MHFTRNVHYGTAQIVRAGGVCGHEAMYDAQMRQYLLRGFFHFAQTEFNVLQTERERGEDGERERAVSVAACTTSSGLALQPQQQRQRVVCGIQNGQLRVQLQLLLNILWTFSI